MLEVLDIQQSMVLHVCNGCGHERCRCRCRFAAALPLPYPFGPVRAIDCSPAPLSKPNC